MASSILPKWMISKLHLLDALEPASFLDLNLIPHRDIRGNSWILLTDHANSCYHLLWTQLIGKEDEDWPRRPGEVQQLCSLPELGDPLKIVHACHILLNQLCCNILGMDLNHNQSWQHWSLHLRQLSTDQGNQISQLGKEKKILWSNTYPKEPGCTNTMQLKLWHATSRSQAVSRQLLPLLLP